MAPINERIERLILNFLLERKTPVSEREISSHVQGRKRSKIASLRQLVFNGRIVRTGAGSKSDPFLYSVAKTGEPDSQSGQAFYKEYDLPNGQRLQLTEDQFNRVVEVFKLLLDQKNKSLLRGAS